MSRRRERERLWCGQRALEKAASDVELSVVGAPDVVMGVTGEGWGLVEGKFGGPQLWKKAKEEVTMGKTMGTGHVLENKW